MNESMKKIKVSIVVTVLNEEETIEALLTALRQQSYPADEIIIVDGGSDDGTLDLLQVAAAENTKIKVFQQHGNRSVGRNFAFSQVRNEVVAITDAGCIPHRDWLESLLNKYQQTYAPVVAGYYDAQPRTALQWAIVPYVLVMPDQVNEQTFLPATRSMLIEKKVWEKVGGFDDNLSDNEDYAFAHALQKKGVTIAFTPHAVVTWLPPNSLVAYARMIFRFARGDIQSGIIRPKVLLLFARYWFFIMSIMMLVAINQSKVVGWLLFLGMIAYIAWAVKKNYRYVKEGWHWLPVLQYTADVAIMVGSLNGWLLRLKKKV